MTSVHAALVNRMIYLRARMLRHCFIVLWFLFIYSSLFVHSTFNIQNTKMKVSVLEVSAQLDNVTDLRVEDNYEYAIKFKCNQCSVESENFMTFNRSDQIPLMGGKAFANLTFQCKSCSRNSIVTIMPNSEKIYKASDSADFKPFVEFDCRGCQPTKFQPKPYLRCIGVDSKEEFNEVELTDNNWADYDEKVKQPVGIYEFKYRFVHLKARPKKA